MSAQPESPLLRIADALARGVLVDWDEETSRYAHLKGELESLREVERMAHAHARLKSEEESDLLLGTTLAHYRIDSVIGSGGMGIVYRAHDRRLVRDVAIKVLRSDRIADDRSKSELLEEARRQCAIKHPNVVPVYDVGEDKGSIFIVMECVDGTTLDDALRQGPLSVHEAVDYGVQISDALVAAHEAGIVHRDLKSKNVCVTKSGIAKVLDFGLSIHTHHHLRDRSASGDLEEPPLPAGTLPYMAPEAIRGERLDERTDIWSLGVVLFEMLAEHRPFPGDHIDRVKRAILQEEPASLPSAAPRALRRVVERCLEKEPRRRYQSAGEVRSALQAVRDSDSTADKARWNWLRVAGATLAIVLLAVSIWFLRPRPAEHALLVMPVQDASGIEEQAFLADGLTDQLITAFARFDSVRVLSLTTSKAIAKDTRPMKTLARVYGLDRVLESSFRRLENRVVVTVRLVDATRDVPVWTQTYNRSLDELFGLEQEIAVAVATQMHAPVTDRDRERFAAPRVQNLDAYRSYVRGRYQASEGNYRLALESYRDATRRDSAFAAAFAGIADCYAEMLYYEQIAWEEGMARAREAAGRALALDSTQTEAHLALAFLHGLRWNWPAAKSELESAFQGEPGNAEVWWRHSMYLGVMGNERQRLFEMRHALSLDPHSSRIRMELGLAFLDADSLLQGADQFRRVAAVDRGPEGRKARAYLGRALALMGRPRDGASEIAAAAEGSPNTLEREELAYALARGGDRAGARRHLGVLTDPHRRDPVSPLAIAAVQVALGEVDPALETLTRASLAMDPRILWLQVDPRFDTIRSHPRYAAILTRLKAAKAS